MREASRRRPSIARPERRFALAACRPLLVRPPRPARRPGGPRARSPHRTATSGRATASPPSSASSAATAGGFGDRPARRADLRAPLRPPHRLARSRSGSGVARGDLQRLIVDPFVALVNRRVSGPVDQTVTFAEVNLQLNLTGGKTWHRLAPFVGAGVGLTFPSGTPADTSRFEFGKKIYLAPMAGVRIFVTDRLSLRGEARAVFLEAQVSLDLRGRARGSSPAIRPTTPTPSSPMATSASGSPAPWLLVGLGYSFSL